MREWKKWWNFVAKANTTPELWIYEDVGDMGWFGEGLTAKMFAKELSDIGTVPEIKVHINSQGGAVHEGIAMYNLLLSNPAKIKVYVEGAAHSIASVIACSGDTLDMAANSRMMIHRAMGGMFGYDDDLHARGNLLTKFTDDILHAYLHKSKGKTESSKFLDLMKAETWLTPDEAKELGLVDTISGTIQILASSDLSRYGYQNIPSALRNQTEYRNSRQRCARMSIKCQQLRAASGK